MPQGALRSVHHTTLSVLRPSLQIRIHDRLRLRPTHHNEMKEIAITMETAYMDQKAWDRIIPIQKLFK